MPTNDITELEALNDLTWRAIEARRDVVSGRRIDRPSIIPGPRQDAEARFCSDFAVLVHLDAALALAATTELAELADSFARNLHRLRWSQNPGYTASNCSRSFLDGYAYAGFSGPDAPLLCAAPRGGFVLIGPDVVYPGHHHQPREVYLVMTPGSQWRLDEGEWFDVAPGDLLFHDSWQMHAMRTRAQPLLAFAGWIEAGDRRAVGWSDSVGASGGGSPHANRG